MDVSCDVAVALCQPRVATDDLVAELNASNNFSRFVQAMRRRFKESL
jgi:Chromosome segregation protein Spc25